MRRAWMTLLPLLTIGYALASDEPRPALFYVDGDQKMVQVRMLALWLQIPLQYDKDLKQATIRWNGRKIIFKANSRTMLVDQRVVALSVPIKIDESFGRLYVPVTPLAHAVGANITLEPIGDWQHGYCLILRDQVTRDTLIDTIGWDANNLPLRDHITEAESNMLLAVRDGDVTKVKRILQHSSRLVNARNTNWQTPLHIAAHRDDVKMAKMLLAYGAEVNARDYEGDTPLHIAATGEIVKLLLAHRANKEARDINPGQTPLASACLDGRVSAAVALMDNGADINAKEIGGNTLLHEAATSGLNWSEGSEERLTVIRMLIERGALIDARNNNLETPLHKAARWSAMEFIAKFIAKGSNINAQDYDGYTPLHYAILEHQRDAIELLLQHGASTTLHTNEGDTPLEFARHRAPEVLDIFRKHGIVGVSSVP